MGPRQEEYLSTYLPNQLKFKFVHSLFLLRLLLIHSYYLL